MQQRYSRQMQQQYADAIAIVLVMDAMVAVVINTVS